MTTELENPASGIRKLLLLVVLAIVLISLLAFGSWKLLVAQPEVSTVGSCTAVKQSAGAEAREV